MAKVNSLDEALRQIRLRRGRIGTPEEQAEAKKKHNIKMRKLNKNAREVGFARGIEQARIELMPKKRRKTRKK